MKLFLNSLSMAVLSICVMTMLSLSITRIYAQEVNQQAELNQQNSEQLLESQKEVVALFFEAAKTGNNEIIHEFLKHGFPVDVKNHAGFTPLMMATYYGHQNVVATLLENGADRCARDNKGNTALMGAIFKLEWSIAKQLNKADCDINAKQTGQKTVAEFAKMFGQENQLKKLSIEN